MCVLLYTMLQQIIMLPSLGQMSQMVCESLNGKMGGNVWLTCSDLDMNQWLTQFRNMTVPSEEADSVSGYYLQLVSFGCFIFSTAYTSSVKPKKLTWWQRHKSQKPNIQNNFNERHNHHADTTQQIK